MVNQIAHTGQRTFILLIRQINRRIPVSYTHLDVYKRQVTYTPNADCGDNVIIINAGQAVLTGKKPEQKIYRTHSGWIGGLKETKYRILMQEKPETAMRVAVRGMMPRNTVCKDSLKRLHIYADANYEQQAQKPIVLE